MCHSALFCLTSWSPVKKHATYVTKWSLKFSHHDRLQRTDRQEYICVLSLTLRTPGWPTRREYSSTPLTLFAWLRVRVRPSVVPCVHGMHNWTSDNDSGSKVVCTDARSFHDHLRVEPLFSKPYLQWLDMPIIIWLYGLNHLASLTF